MALKIIPMLLVVVAGTALGYVAWRAPERAYVAPTIEEVKAHTPAPTSLVGAIPADCVVRTFHVEGMCCKGCTGKIYERLKATSGVVQAAVSFDAETAQVVVPATADVASLERVLAFDKYTATLVE